MTDIDPDKAAELVEEAAAIIREHNGNPPEGFWEETQRRILAATHPKGPWPVDISNGNAFAALEIWPSSVEVHFENANGAQNVWANEVGMDRLVVAWLQHRGVDLEYAMRSCMPEAFDEDTGYLTDTKDEALLRAIQSILDNAGAVE